MYFRKIFFIFEEGISVPIVTMQLSHTMDLYCKQDLFNQSITLIVFRTQSS